MINLEKELQNFINHHLKPIDQLVRLQVPLNQQSINDVCYIDTRKAQELVMLTSHSGIAKHLANNEHRNK